MSGLRIAIYHNLHSGGAKRVAAEHLHRLAGRHRVALFSLSSADHNFAMPECGPAITVSLQEHRPLPYAPSPFGRINPLIGILNIARLDILARRTAAQIDAAGFDVMLAYPCQVTQAPLLLRWLRTPSLYYCQELPRRLYEPPIDRPYLVRGRVRRVLDLVDPLPALIRSVLRRVDQQNARHATRIVANSRLTCENIRMAYGREADVCEPCVAAEHFRPVDTERAPFVLSVGALTPAKGFDFVIQAIGTLPAASRPPLVIISNYQEPDELAYVTALAQQQGVALECRVGVPEEELRAWYARAGCVAYAPVREPFGLVALEAMAAGAAIVGVNEGGVVETIIDGVTGRLAPRSPALFGQAIAMMLEQPERAQQFGQAARRHVLDRWTWARHIEHLEHLLEKTAGNTVPMAAHEAPR